MRYQLFLDLFSLIFPTNKNIIEFSQLRMDLKGQLSFTEPFSVHLKDLLPFFVSILEVNGTSGFLQGNSRLFPLGKIKLNLQNKLRILQFSKVFQQRLITVMISWIKRLEMLKSKPSITLVLLVLNKLKIKPLLSEKEMKMSHLELFPCQICSSYSKNRVDHQNLKEDQRCKRKL